MIAMSWSNFVQLSLAFGPIRQKRLYRMEYDSFEAYCGDYVYKLISAAQLSTFLSTISLQTKSDGETQVYHHRADARTSSGRLDSRGGKSWRAQDHAPDREERGEGA